VAFRVLVDDNGQPSLGDAMQFFVNVQNIAPVVDLNGPAQGIDRTATLPEGQTNVAVTDSQLTVTDGDQATLESATVTINTILDGPSESLQVDTTGTNISQMFNSATGALSLTGEDTVVNYQRVLRTLRYQNLAATPTVGQRRLEVTVHDGMARSQPANVVVTVVGPNSAPTLASLPAVTLLSGSPLHIALDAEDLNGDDLTFTVTSSNPSLVSPQVLTGNRSLRMDVTNFGEMVFELFEDRAPRATQQIIALANDGFYDGIIFHRVIGDFVIQAGDPTGSGSGGSSRPDFDDQFHFELQHNRTGVLSMAKTTDDTNNSQFFITEGAQRHLDFNHTVFGQLVEGETVRESISAVAVNNSGKPLSNVTIESAEVFTDNENGVVMLNAAAGATGSAMITVQVSDGRGGTATRQFTVNVQPDTINGAPFLADIPAIQTELNTPTSFQLVGRDVEGDPVFFLDEEALSSRGLFLPVASHPDMDYSVNPTTGMVTVTPRNGLRGTFSITVAAAASLNNLNANSPIDYQVVRVTVGVDPT
jgi:cyclophilin family peptidyl-prolyl cis-trans isomerase